MEAVIEVWMGLRERMFESVSASMKIESLSSPPEGTVEVGITDSEEDPILVMRSTDLSTARAMLNSYMGLLTVALKTSEEG